MAFAMSELLWVGILPCGVAALVMLVSTWLGLPNRAAWAKSVGGGYVVGQIALASRVDLRTGIGILFAPREAVDWLPWLVMAAVGITVLAAYAPRHWQRWIVALAVVVAAAAPARLLAGSVYVTSRWTAIEKIGVILIWATAFALIWAWLAAGRSNGQPRVRGGLLVLVAIGMAAALTLSGSIALGELCGVMAASLTGTTGFASALVMISERRPSHSHADALCSTDGLSGAAGAIAMALGGLLLLGYFYAELKATNVTLLLAALVAAGGRLPTVWPRGAVWRAVFRAVLCIVPLAVALGLTWAAIQADSY
jgi:hypothetical protein